MARIFKYRVCQVQAGRVTFVNGNWQGLQVPVESNPAELYNSCPMVWEYLDSAGRDGWELVTSSSQAGDFGPGALNAITLLFLKKESSDSNGGSSM